MLTENLTVVLLVGPCPICSVETKEEVEEGIRSPSIITGGAEEEAEAVSMGTITTGTAGYSVTQTATQTVTQTITQTVTQNVTPNATARPISHCTRTSHSMRGGIKLPRDWLTLPSGGNGGRTPYDARRILADVLDRAGAPPPPPWLRGCDRGSIGGQ
eukprot:306035-Prorocentrum_minimum.AAC.4